MAEHEAATPPTDTIGVEEVLDLGFGGCKLQVQVPEAGDITEAKQLVGKNIVTSFTQLSEAYFRKLEEEGGSTKGVNGDAQGKLKTRIKYVGGSVEAACALGVADGIVDLVGECHPQHSFSQSRTNTTQNQERRCERQASKQSTQ